MKKYIIIIAVIIITAYGCSEQLELFNPNEISENTFWTSESDAELALTGVYNTLQAGSVYGARFREFDGFGGIGYFQWQTDGLIITEGGATAENGYYNVIWKGYYDVVNKANLVIDNVQAGIEGLSVTRANQIEAEAKFARALAYLTLTMLYRDVPLIIHEQKFSERYVEKTSQSEILKVIYDDVDFAVNNLPDSWSGDDLGRVDKWGALALKARAHLYFKDWVLAGNAAKEIIDGGRFSLYQDFGKLFSVEAEGNEESIFAVRFESGLGEGESFSGTYRRVTQGTMRPLPEYVKEFYCIDGLPIDVSPLYNASAKDFKNRDPRLDFSVLYKTEKWVDNLPINSNSPTGYDMQKYQRNVLAFYNDGPQDFMVFRYADILLIRAEALIEQNELTQEVYDLINQVRQRPTVEMPTIESVEGTGLSQQELREILHHERNVEFGFEGLNFFDLKRWDKLEETYQSVTFHNRVYMEGRTEVWPIPQREIDNNPNLEQHQEWQ
jgi:starch-binding outer membrane protein, SusD/RagB family